ncbi:hypothetical protein H633G_00030 [Metarhizium anisopliae BRIP 53284]|nr:hypothetical protein H633G_00030 [Metarhizium anisopliae BRIP 53284]
MSSITPPHAPTEAALEPLRDELKGNMLPNVHGFFAKYFEGKSWSTVTQNKFQETTSANMVGKLSARVTDLANLDVLVEWLAEFQTLFFGVDQANLRFCSQPLSNTSSTPKTAIYLETSDVQSAAGSTRVFGEFHLDSAPVMADDDDDDPALLRASTARVQGPVGSMLCPRVPRAYSSERLDLAQKPDLLVCALAGYTLMTDEEAGFNTFVQRLTPESDSYVTFHQSHTFRLQPELMATADYIVGPGTTCYAASTQTAGEPDTVIKFSWREDQEPTEVRLLKLAHERNAWGVIQLLDHQDLVNVADLRQEMDFPRPFANRILSCVATTPLSRPIRQFASIPELLEALRDLVRALHSLYVKARILHRDVAIKNLIIAPHRTADGPKGVLLDFNFALDLDNVRPVEPMVGSDGFMAIGILSGQRHTYRHDLESLFYVFLWIAIANDGVHDEANDILEDMPTTSRLWKWCSMDFGAVGRDKAADMSPEGFEGILDEFCSDFAPLRGLARELHALLFPVRQGKIFTGTDTDPVAVERLHDGMADAFNWSALAFQG